MISKCSFLKAVKPHIKFTGFRWLFLRASNQQSTLFGLAWIGMDWHGLVWIDLDWLGEAWLYNRYVQILEATPSDVWCRI